MRIYLSSTYEDLKDHRRAVFGALRKSGHEVIAMEDYVAADRRPVDKCLADVRRADVYVGVFALRYGYVPPADHGNPDGLSIAELEYREAEEHGVPCLLYVLDEKHPWPRTFDDAQTGDNDAGKKIARLLAYLRTEKLARSFSTEHQLASEVQAAVSKLEKESQAESAAASTVGESDKARESGEDDADTLGARRREPFRRVAQLAGRLKSRSLAVAAAVLGFSAVIWFAGPFISLGGSAPLASAESRLSTIVLLLFVWALIIVPAISLGLVALLFIWSIGPKIGYALLQSLAFRWLATAAVLALVALWYRRRRARRATGADQPHRWAPLFVRFGRFAVAISVLGAAVYATFALSSAAVSRLLQPLEAQAASAPCTAALGQGPQMLLVDGGTFEMGSAEGEGSSGERPSHSVTVQAFSIGRCEVTFDDYDRFASATGRNLPDDFGWGRGSRPVINVSWEDAIAYAAWLSDQTGKSYRLPSEAEWKYAARAGTATRFWWGDDVGEGRANCNGCGSRWDGEQTAPVGSFAPNAFGLYDTAGNAWEWTQDCWHDTYEGAPADGTAWLDDGGGDCSLRVLRGGSWLSEPDLVRSAVRIRFDLDVRNLNVGFRLAQDL